jgi:DNA-directed RNA polymerase I, II, and III subunit RPABC1
MDNQYTNNSDIYRSFQTIKEMLLDRGMVDMTHINSISTDEFDILARQSDNNVFQVDVNEGMKIIYYMNVKFKIGELRKYLQPYIADSPVTTLIIVFKERVNNFTPKNIDELANIDVQVFTLKELLFNISRHELVPRHEVIRDPTQIADLVATHNLKSKLQFPIILKTDPMARYLNVQSGELVKVTRTSPSAGLSIVYRCCV